MTFKPSALFGQTLEVKSGVVTHLQSQTVERYMDQGLDPHKRPDMKAYTYISKFSLNASPIVAMFNIQPEINEGDTLMVSGIQKEDFFEVLAYRNETKDITGSNPWKSSVIAAILFALFAGVLYFFVLKQALLIEQILLLGFIGLGLFLIARAYLIKEALQLLSSQ